MADELADEVALLTIALLKAGVGFSSQAMIYAAANVLARHTRGSGEGSNPARAIQTGSQRGGK